MKRAAALKATKVVKTVATPKKLDEATMKEVSIVFYSITLDTVCCCFFDGFHESMNECVRLMFLIGFMDVK